MPTSSPRTSQSSGEGWAVFAGVLFLLAGICHVMWGISALANDDDFAVDELLFGDLTLWGVVYLAIGAAQLGAAALIATSNAWGRVLGIGLAVLSAINAMLTLSARPFWGVLILVLDVLVIYGLAIRVTDDA